MVVYYLYLGICIYLLVVDCTYILAYQLDIFCQLTRFERGDLDFGALLVPRGQCYLATLLDVPEEYKHFNN